MVIGVDNWSRMMIELIKWGIDVGKIIYVGINIIEYWDKICGRDRVICWNFKELGIMV